jgi:hypothetical protein
MGQLFFGMLRGGGGYPDAMTAALWFNAAAFVAVALLVWRLPEPRLVPESRPGRRGGDRPEPAPAE